MKKLFKTKLNSVFRYRGKLGGLAALLGSAALAVAPAVTSAADVTYERLLNPEPHNWLMVHKDYNSQRYSTLDQINKSNIKNLKLKYAIAIGGASPNEALEVTPLVEDGFISAVPAATRACATGSPRSIRRPAA